MNIDFEASRMRDIPFSDIRRLFERVNEMKAQGLSPIPFHIGQPDFDTPMHIKQAAKDALDRGLTAYSSNYGLPALRQAIANKLLQDNKIMVDPDKQVLVTVGSNEAIFMAMLATLNVNDEVLIPNPSWMHYQYCAELVGAKVVSVPLREENGFQIDPDDLEALVSAKTKMLVLNTPHNPTGAVYGLETLTSIAKFVEKHQLVLLSDEIYEKLIYSDQPHLSPGSIEMIKDQTITVNGFSKAYAMTGWRVGYAAASERLIGAMVRAHQYTNICATTFAQAGALAALTGPQDCVENMFTEFSRRRQVVVGGLQNTFGIKLIPPQGTFYAFPNIKGLDESSTTVANLLLEDAGVAVVPGRAFGKNGEGYIRISFACSLPEVKRGMEAITKVSNQINPVRLN